MAPLALALLALSLSADAFAVATGKGVALKRPAAREVMRTGAIFGSIEALNLVLGWLAGSVAGLLVARYDHWIAFVILSALGLKMISECWCCKETEEKPKTEKNGFFSLALAAVGSSIDSMGVGVTLAFVAQPIFPAALAVGSATFMMSSLGLKFGHLLGCKIGRGAEILGGLVLIAIGIIILWEHTHSV